MSFTAVVTGNPTNAADLNQLIDAVNGTAQGQFIFYSTGSSAVAAVAKLPSAPSADQGVVRVIVNGDSQSRIGLAIGSTARSHYGGLVGGVGSLYTAHMFATADGFAFDEDISGPIGGGIPTTRNGAALSVPIFTGSSTPSSPPTGSMWFPQ